MCSERCCFMAILELGPYRYEIFGADADIREQDNKYIS